MRWTQKLNDNIKRGIRSWLNITPANPFAIQINEVMDFELSAIRNRIWYRGDSNELEQMYRQNPEWADRYKFWAGKPTSGMEIRKLHTGLPGLMVRTLVSIIMPDMNDFEFESPKQADLWAEIAEENDFKNLLQRALREVLAVGDGAFKIVLNTSVSPYPILEWYPGERIELLKEYGRLKEVVFKTPYVSGGQKYVLYEHYGFGYIRNELYRGDVQTDPAALEATKALSDWEFDNTVLLAVPMMVFDSAKFEGRGGSIFDGKLDNFDALDEAWSQWMDALRAGRAKTYIPETLVPRNPNTGEILPPNPFDNRYIAAGNDMAEGAKNQISTEQPAIPHDSYSASYITALDLCLQGVISPSTLGIDVKKLDNAEAQREKEKATLYTRNAVVSMLQSKLPKLIESCLAAHWMCMCQAVETVKVDIPFGEYANPSFESQVETVGKGKQSGIMSIEAAVEELYGATRDDDWKAQEVARLKAEQGVLEAEEPAVNLALGGFRTEVTDDEGERGRPIVPNGL